MELTVALLSQAELGDRNPMREPELESHEPSPDLAEAEDLLLELASVFNGMSNPAGSNTISSVLADDAHASSLEAKYRALLEQIPAVVFMAYIDRGVSEAYVSPEIEAALGYSREEWLEDPVRWYEHIHPDDKQR